MMHQHNRSVNVDRYVLLDALRKNLLDHRAEYAQAVVDFRQKLSKVLADSQDKVVKLSDAEILNLRITIPTAPVNHEDEYIEVIEMLEMSVDQHINLSVDLFKAYVKNQWGWTNSFKSLVGSYKA